MLRLIRVHGAQLVTITGPPGVGKTRFAAEVAVELEGRLDVVLLDDVDAVDERADLRLVTRTEPLRVAHERAYRLRPLAEAPAVELFRQRADAAAQRYGASYAELAALCRRLGRLPLAIILAAGRAPAAVADLCGRRWMLDEVIHWSCERLSARERDVLRAAATGWATAADAPEIDRLVTLGLLTPVRAGVATHPAIRAIAASL